MQRDLDKYICMYKLSANKHDEVCAATSYIQVKTNCKLSGCIKLLSISNCTV